MATEWFYSRDGQQFGPVSSQQLKELAASGKLQASDQVWKEGMAEWVAANKLKGLFPAVASDVATAAPAAQQEPPVASVPSAIQADPTPTQGPSGTSRKRSSGLLIAGVSAGALAVLVFIVVLFTSGNRDDENKHVADGQGAPKQQPDFNQHDETITRLQRDINDLMPQQRQTPNIPQIDSRLTSDPAAPKGVRRPSEPASGGELENPVAANGDNKQPEQPSTMLLLETPVATLKGGQFSDAISFITFSPNGKFLFVKAANGNCRLWDVKTWTERLVDPSKRTGGQATWVAKTAVFSPDGKLLACIEGESFEFLKVWNLQTTPASLVNSIRIHNFNSNSYWHGAVWSENGQTLVTRGPRRGLQFWGNQGPTGGVEISVAGSGGGGQRPNEDNQWFWTKDVTCSPDGMSLATIFERGVRIWSIPSGEESQWIQRPDPQSDWTFHPFFGFSPDGKLLATTLKRDATQETDFRSVEIVRIWDTSGWKETVTIDGRNAGGINFSFRAFSPDNRLIVTSAGSTWNNTIAIWDSATGKKLHQFKTTSIGKVLFGPDERMLVTGGHSYLLKNKLYNVNIWDATTGQLRARITDRTVSTVAVSPDGNLLVTGNGYNEVKVWDINRGKTVPYVDEYAE